MDATQEEDVVGVGELISRISRYRTWDLLAKVGDLANRVEREGNLWTVTRRTRRESGRVQEDSVHFSPWALAFIAKYSILEGDNYRTPTVSDNDLYELVSMYNNLDDPFLHKPDGQPFEAFSYLVRTGWEQFSFQEGVRQLIPRYYALLRLFNEHDSTPVMDISREWQARSGITIEDYMTLGLAAWAKACKTPVFRKAIFAETEVQALRKRSTHQNLTAFFNLCTADYERFRAESERFALPPTYARTEFNALRKYPLIEAHRHELTAPVPQLIIERATKGICYEMQALFQEDKRNVFKEQLGRNFESYVGFLLAEAYGRDAVLAEPVYGKPQKRGPDWILQEGDTAVLFECTVTDTSLESKSIADLETLIRDMGRVYVDRIKKYPQKVADLRKGATGLDMRSIRRFLPVVVTHESLYVEPVARAYIEEGLKQQGYKDIEYYLLDIGDLEVITAWPGKRFVDVFDEWQDLYASEPQSINAFLHKKASAENLRWINPFLTQTLQRFEAEELGPLSDG